LPHGTRAFSYRDFLLRRLVRLEPPYILCLILSYVGYVVVWGADAAETLPRLLASMVYMHSIVYGEFNPMNPVTWSLEIELQFYLLAPVFASVFLIRPAWLRRLIMVVLIALWVYLGRLVVDWGAYNLHYSLLPFGYYFLLGFLLADVLKSPERPTAHWGFDLMALAGLVLIYGETRPIYDALFYAMLFIGVFHSRHVIRLLRQPAIYLIGGMCYTIYLYHLPLFFALAGVFGGFMPFSSYELNYLALALICLPIALVLMSLAYLLMERPFMNVDLQALKRRLARFLAIGRQRTA
jgi:peptidoglycan/LPS O-acetylase OafA/YrhL